MGKFSIFRWTTDAVYSTVDPWIGNWIVRYLNTKHRLFFFLYRFEYKGVTRSYVVEQAAPRVRTYMLARLSALQYAGFAATPLCGSAVIILRDISSIIISTKLVVNTNSWWWLARQSQIFGNLRCRRISSLL